MRGNVNEMVWNTESVSDFDQERDARIGKFKEMIKVCGKDKIF